MDLENTMMLILSELQDLKQGQHGIQQDINCLKQDINYLKSGQEDIKKTLLKHDSQLASIVEALNVIDSNLTSKIDVVDKKVNINAVDILELRAAK